ncbi:epidermal retinol dehydrogenase 2 [Lepeophtheirus salmonis]|uniref:Short-chain dehydrogenase/reductase 3 n=1 Tax=Lepeophtheirus salmonis TaxID=72036 RepID=A0A0K2U725_LEPSM|nr:epidermal retinol dehydrogenase 2-like [Lepeophtheirus salmonis]
MNPLSNPVEKLRGKRYRNECPIHGRNTWIQYSNDPISKLPTMTGKLFSIDIFPRFALIIYRINILIFDIFIFLISAILEYARLIYRYFIPRERKSIEGLNALVTGAGNGIGRQLAIELARNGANIVCLDFLINENEETSAEIKKQFPNIKTWTVTCDVSSKKDVKLAIDVIKKSVGDIDILINNAGTLCCKPFVQHDFDQIERIISTNLLGQLWVLRAILPQMIARDTGYVVAMASFAGHAGVPNMVPYTASKFGIKGMMEALFIELRQGNRAHGIHLMTVSPFLVDTGMIKNRRVRFPDILDIETPERAAEVIISNMRQGNAIVFIPNILYYLMSIIRILPSRVQLLITDFLDSGIGVDYDQQ